MTEIEALTAERDEWKRKADERGQWLDRATHTIAETWRALGITTHVGGPGLADRVRALVGARADAGERGDRGSGLVMSRFTVHLIVTDRESGVIALSATVAPDCLDPGLSVEDATERFLAPSLAAVRHELRSIDVPPDGGAYKVTKDGQATR